MPESFLTRYCTAAPVSMLFAPVNAPTLVSASLPVPSPPNDALLLSVVSATLGVAGLVVSNVYVIVCTSPALFALST